MLANYKTVPHLVSFKDGSVLVLPVAFKPKGKPLVVFDNLMADPMNFRFKGKDKEELIESIKNLFTKLSHQKPLVPGEYETEMPADM